MRGQMQHARRPASLLQATFQSRSLHPRLHTEQIRDPLALGTRACQPTKVIPATVKITRQTSHVPGRSLRRGNRLRDVLQNRVRLGLASELDPSEIEIGITYHQRLARLVAELTLEAQ